MSKIFHLAIPCKDIDETLEWYTKHFKCEVKRKMPTTKGAHVDFYGNQITFVEVPPEELPKYLIRNEHGSPLPHFGVCFEVEEWQKLSDYLQQQDDVVFDVLPHLKFKDYESEHFTMFIRDPSNNALELKAFTKTKTWL
jgi:extradiol dioxygenase family protein